MIANDLSNSAHRSHDDPLVCASLSKKAIGLPETLPAQRARLKPWLRTSILTDHAFSRVARLLADADLQTVCRSARCPNRHTCWNEGTATFMILGEVCTRNCRYCAVSFGIPALPDPDQPNRLAAVAAALQLRYVVVTSVTRDDLPDGGAQHFAAVIAALRMQVPGVCIDVLTPDFQGSPAALQMLAKAAPDVFSHNMETVMRLHSVVRPQAEYARSLTVLRYMHEVDPKRPTKSGLMLGLGESDSEIRATLEDLRRVGVSLLTLGQYIAPSSAHMPVARFLEPCEFDAWSATALELGFRGVASAPLVRSSYRAAELWRQTQAF